LKSIKKILLIYLFLFPSQAQASYYPLFEPAVPNKFSISIKGLDYKKFIIRLLKAQRSPVIGDISKKKFKGTISVINKDRKRIHLKGKIRISGDVKDHIDLKNTFSSLHISLVNGHIGNITKFKLFLPHTRNGENEVFWTALLRSYGFPAPFTKSITVLFNGVPHKVIFQEVLTKEFLERHQIRETVILKGDERPFWESARKRGIAGLGPAILYPNYNYKHITNKSFIEKLPDRNHRLFIGIKGINKVHHLQLLKKIPERFKHMENGSFFYQINNKYAPHSLKDNNLKYAYDPLFNSLIPLYYDGNVDFTDCKGLKPPFGSAEPLKNTSIQKKYLKEQINSLNINASKLYDCVSNDILEIAERLNYWQDKSPLKQRVKTFQYFPSDYNTEIHPGIEGEVPLLVFFDGKFSECRFRSGLFQFNKKNCKDLSQKRIISFLSGKAKSTKNNKGSIYPINFGIIKSNLSDIQNSDIFLSIPSSSYEETISLNPKKNLFIYFKKSYQSRKIKILLDKNQSSRIIVSGYLGLNDSIEVLGTQELRQTILGNLSHSSRFNERLLTGCLTIVDAALDRSKFYVNGATCEDAINFIRSSGHIAQIIVRNSKNDAVDIDFSNLTIDHIFVDKAGNDCIDLSTGNYSLGNLFLRKCTDKALSAGERSNVHIESLHATQAKIFIASKDESSVKLDDGLGLNIEKKCIDVYSKKQEFDTGTFKGENFSCEPTKF
jgi:hypothetical protein